MTRVRFLSMQNPLFLALISTFANILVSMTDSLISNHIFKPYAQQSIVSSLSYLTLGGIFGSLYQIFYAHAIGKSIDNSGSIFNFQGKGIEFHSQAARNGLVGAIATGIGLYGYSTLDLGTVLVLGSSSFLFVLLYDHFKRRTIKIQTYMFEICILIPGIFFAAYNPHRISTMVSSIVLMVLLRGLLKGYKSQNDKDVSGVLGSKIATVWCFIYLAVFGAILSVALVYILGYQSIYFATLKHVVFDTYFLLALTGLMLCVFLSNGWKNEAKNTDTDVTTFEIIAYLEIPLLFIVSLVGNSVSPGLFGKVPTETETLVVRTFGMLMVTSAVIMYTRKKRKLAATV